MTLPPSNSRTGHLRMDSPVRHSGINDNCPALGATWPLEGPILTALSFLFTLASLTAVRPTAVAKASRNPCEDMQVLQGVQDTRALVGKVFFYPISPFAFQGKVTHYKVSLASGSALPKWLEYNTNTSTLQGLPLPEERGEYRLTVIAYGEPCGPHRPTTDVNFALHVQDCGFVHGTDMGQDQRNLHNNICPGAPCATKVSITFAELIIYHRTSSLGIQERLYLVCTMAEYLHLDPSSLTLTPFEDSFHRYLWNLTILAEDIRYVHTVKNHYVGLCWPVGFGVFAMFYELLQVLRHTMESNHLSQLLGYEIAGWRILKQGGHEKQYSGKRLRRQLMATPRLTPRPTKTEGFMVLSTTWLHTKSVARSHSSLLDDVTKTAILTYTGDFLRSVSSETDLEALDTQNLLNVQIEKSTSSAFQNLSSAFPELLPSLIFTFSDEFLHSVTRETDVETLDTHNLPPIQTKNSTALQDLSSAFPELLPSLIFTFSNEFLHSVIRETDLETLGTHNLPPIQTKNSTVLQDLSSVFPELSPSLIFTFSDDFLHSVTSEGDLALDMQTQLNIQTKMTASSIHQDFPSAFPELLPSLMTSAEMEDDITSRPPISQQLQSQVPQQEAYSSPKKSESKHHFVFDYFGFSVPTSKTQLSKPSHFTTDSYVSPEVTPFKIITSPDYSGPYAELTASGVILRNIISTATSGLIQDSKSFTAKIPVVPVSTLVNQRASFELPLPMSSSWQSEDLSSNYKYVSEVYMPVPQTDSRLLTEEHYSPFATIQSEIASWKTDFSFIGIPSTSGSSTGSKADAYEFGSLLDTSSTIPLYYSDSIPALAMYSSTQEFNTPLSTHFLESGLLSRTCSTPAQFPSLPLSLSTDLTIGLNDILPVEELFSGRRQVSPEVFQISENSLGPFMTVLETDGYLFTDNQISAFTATHIDTPSWNKQSHPMWVATTSAPVLSGRILSENGLSRGTSWTPEWSSYGAPVLSWPIEFAGSLKSSLSTNEHGSDYSRYVRASAVAPGPPLHQDMSDVSLASSFGTQANFQITKGLTSERMKESAIPYDKETPLQPGFYATSMYPGAQGEANTSPRIVRAIKWLTATIGHKFSFSIPPDTFYDQEDGNTAQLTLGINPADYSPTGLESWLQFNSCCQTLYGYPLDHDFQYSPQEFVLFATDSGGLRASDTLTIELLSPTLIPCHIYTLRTKNSYHSFLRNRERISLFFEKLSSYLNAGSPGNMTLLHLRPGSTVIAWYNHSMCARTKQCATDEIQGVLTKLRVPGGNVHPDFIQAMLPEYKIDHIEDVTYGGICSAIAKPFNESVPSNTTLGSFKDSRSWIRNILSALLIGVSTTVMVILIITFHYRKYRKKGSGLQSALARPFFSYVDFEMDVLKSRKPPILEQEARQAPRPWLHMPPPTQQHPRRPNRTLIASRLPPPPKYRLPPPYGKEESGQSCHDHSHRRSCPKASLY